MRDRIAIYLICGLAAYAMFHQIMHGWSHEIQQAEMVSTLQGILTEAVKNTTINEYNSLEQLRGLERLLDELAPLHRHEGKR